MRIFVTGASGWIGSAVVPELLGAGHEVVGLARSEASAKRLEAAGATVLRGDLDDPDGLREPAKSADGVIHLAFRHDLLYSGEMAAAGAVDRHAIEALGDALSGSDRPFAIASGVFGIAPGQPVTERDGIAPAEGFDEPIAGASDRMANAHYTLALASRGVRSSVLRLPPTCHGEGDNGFMSILVGVAREKGVSGYVGDGSARWPATHRRDVAKAFRLAVEKAPAGSTLHAVAEEGVAGRDFAEVIGRKLGIPVVSVPHEDALAHFGFLGHLLPIDSPASSEQTREVLGWEPSAPSLINDLEHDYYYRQAQVAV